MGTVHQLIRDEGRQSALEFGFDRLEVEAASSYLADEEGGIGFLYSGWCQTALPHRRLLDADGWQIQTDHTTLIVEPGMRAGPAGKPIPVGVPYGSRARLILIFLQSEAIRSRSREIELGGSLRAWLARLGIPQGGTSLAAVRDQAERLARCRITFEVQSGNATGMLSQTLIDGALFVDESDLSAGRAPRFLDRARLSQAFFDALKKHPVPLEESAIKSVSNNSQALDAYTWLAYRLHCLTAPRKVSWRALKVQFGAGFGRLDHFRARFLPNLRLALAVYPEAKVEIGEGGIILHPSRPPIAKEKLALR